MTRLLSILAFMSLALTCQLAHSETVKVPDNFRLIGSMKEERLDCLTTYYFLSQNSTGWTTAERDCKKNFGKDATLIYVETQEELVMLTEFTEFIDDSDDTGASYFTGGMYSVALTQFEWKNGVPIDVGWFPWFAGHPNTRTDATKVVAVRVPGIGIQFKTVLQTESQRYICEFRG